MVGLYIIDQKDHKTFAVCLRFSPFQTIISACHSDGAIGGFKERACFVCVSTRWLCGSWQAVYKRVVAGQVGTAVKCLRLGGMSTRNRPWLINLNKSFEAE